MLSEQIMKRDVECVSPVDTVEEAARRMRDEKVGFLPVCDQSKKVLGTITDRDLVIRVLASKKPPTTPVDDVMTKEVVSCGPKDDLQRAMQLMAENQKSRIMCVDGDGRLVGVISLSDIAQEEPAGQASEVLRQVSGREVRA